MSRRFLSISHQPDNHYHFSIWHGSAFDHFDWFYSRMFYNKSAAHACLWTNVKCGIYSLYWKWQRGERTLFIQNNVILWWKKKKQIRNMKRAMTTAIRWPNLVIRTINRWVESGFLFDRHRSFTSLEKWCIPIAMVNNCVTVIYRSTKIRIPMKKIAFCYNKIQYEIVLATRTHSLARMVTTHRKKIIVGWVMGNFRWKTSQPSSIIYISPQYIPHPTEPQNGSRSSSHIAFVVNFLDKHCQSTQCIHI